MHFFSYCERSGIAGEQHHYLNITPIISVCHLICVTRAETVQRKHQQHKVDINSSVCLNTVMSNIMILQRDVTNLQHHDIKNMLQIH